MLATWSSMCRRTRSGSAGNQSISPPGSSNFWKRLPPLLAGPLAARNWWSGSTARATMVLTAPLTFIWETCARRSRPILRALPLSRPCMASAINSGGRMMLSSFYLRLISMLYSLRLRLTLMFMLVVMVAVGTVALIASQATCNNLYIYTQAKTDLQKTDLQIISTLLTAYHQHQSQQALQALTEQVAHSSHQRIILLNHQRRVIADSDHTLIGQVIPERTLTAPSSSTSPTSESRNTFSSSFYVSTDF